MLNKDGEVIGITSASYKDSQNINVAVDISHVIEAYQEADPNYQPDQSRDNSNQGRTDDVSANFFAELKLTDLKGNDFDASVFEGKPAFINIWATWCSPCVSEMPHLDELAKEYQDKITIIGLHAEGMNVKDGQLVPWEEKNQAARELVEKLGLTFPIINPDQNLFVLMMSQDYGLQVTAYPTTWLVDGNGSVASVVPGSRTKEDWKEIIDGFLKYLEENAVEKNEG